MSFAPSHPSRNLRPSSSPRSRAFEEGGSVSPGTQIAPFHQSAHFATLSSASTSRFTRFTSHTAALDRTWTFLAGDAVFLDLRTPVLARTWHELRRSEGPKHATCERRGVEACSAAAGRSEDVGRAGRDGRGACCTGARGRNRVERTPTNRERIRGEGRARAERTSPNDETCGDAAWSVERQRLGRVRTSSKGRGRMEETRRSGPSWTKRRILRTLVVAVPNARGREGSWTSELTVKRNERAGEPHPNVTFRCRGRWEGKRDPPAPTAKNGSQRKTSWACVSTSQKGNATVGQGASSLTIWRTCSQLPQAMVASALTTYMDNATEGMRVGSPTICKPLARKAGKREGYALTSRGGRAPGVNYAVFHTTSMWLDLHLADLQRKSKRRRSRKVQGSVLTL